MKKSTTTNERKNVGIESKIPNLELYVKNAFNVKDGDFLGDQVFEVTYNNNNETTWDENKKIYPDQLNSIDIKTITNESDKTTLMRNISSYNEAFSLAIDAAYTGVNYSTSVNSNYIYRGSMFTQSDSYYAYNTYVTNLASFERANEPSTTAIFQAALNALEENISTTGSKKKYFDFFTRFGTHYVTKGKLGGSIRLETRINSLLFNEYSEEDIKGEISVAYKNVVKSAKLTLGATHNASSFFEKNKDTTLVTLSIHGGIPTNDRTTWFQSCYQTPSLLLNSPDILTKQTQLVPISNLCNNKKVKGNIETLLSEYMKVEANKSEGITLLYQPAINKVEKSSRDGFLISKVFTKSNGGRSHTEGLIGESQGDLQFKLGASQHYYFDQNNHIGTSTLCMPVYDSAYFESKFHISSSDSGIENQFFSLDNRESRTLGDYLPVDFGTEITMPVDGFVVASINGFQSNGSRSYITGFQKINGETKQMIGASQQFNGDSLWVPMNSFCMPVKANTDFKVDYVATAGFPEGKAYFIPIIDNVEFGDKPLYRNTNSIYTAETDGFLVGFIQDGADGNRAYLDAFSSNNQDNLKNESPIASASVHFHYGGDRHIGQNAITIPVPKGNFYKLALTNTWGHCNVTAYWIPIQASVRGSSQFNIALIASNGKYVCAEDNGNKALIADRDALASWETFSIIILPRVSQSGNKLVALKAVNQKYVSANGENSLIASSSDIGENEIFELIESNGKFALIASNKKYICNQDDGARALSADRSKLGAWELFQIEIPIGHLASKKVLSMSEIEALMQA